MVRRFGSVVGLRPEQQEKYLRLHTAVWPEVEETIRKCNIQNYTIFIHQDLLFSYYEYVGDDHAADMAAMASDPATQRWWALTDPCQRRLDPDSQEQWTTLPEAWHLD